MPRAVVARSFDPSDPRWQFWTGRRLTAAEDGVSLGPRVDAPRLAWWPAGAPGVAVAPTNGERSDGTFFDREPFRRGFSGAELVALVSSRLPRALDRAPELFRRLRRALEAAARRGERVAIVEGTAASEAVRRAAERAGLPRLSVHVARERESLARWIAERSERGGASAEAEWRLELSPPLIDAREAGAGEFSGAPPADRVALALAGRLEVLSVRRGGNWAGLLEQIERQETRWRPAIERRDAEPDDSSGARRMRVDRSVESGRGADAGVGGEPSVEEEPGGGDWLLHCTRRCDGPWPGQAPEEYWDELLDERPERDRSPEATLRRILGEERLRSSTRAIRGAAAMVCFSATTLAELPRRRAWRGHRRRWDFEPYGLAVRRATLERLGARPVTYGDEATWRDLGPEERPFYQAAGRAIDWRDEREWRVAGDVDLGSLAVDDVVVFAPDDASAARLRAASRFPVMVVGDS